MYGGPLVSLRKYLRSLRVLKVITQYYTMALAAIVTLNASTAGLLSVVLVATVFFLRSGKKKLPPGPFAYPLVGNLPQVAKAVKEASATGKKPYLATRKLSEQYGGVVTLWMGSMPMVIVTGYDRVKEGLLDKGNIFINRPTEMFFFKEIFKNKGVLTSSGVSWKDTRKFTMAGMRDFGVGKQSMEDAVMEEVAAVTKVMTQQNGQPFDPENLLSNAVSNTICFIVFGHRFEYDDKDFMHLVGLLNYMFMAGGVNMPENYFPWIKYFFPSGREAPRKLTENNNYINEYVKSRIAEHETSFDPDNMRDFIDLYIRMKRDGNNTKTSLTDEDVYRTLVDLFLGGSETTTTSLHWMLYYMVACPEVQAKCHAELEHAVGSGRAVSLSDRNDLPYCMAVMQESQRLRNSTPSTPPHTTIEDTSIGGVAIPANTAVMFHLQSVHTDPSQWGPDPNAFRPDRWICETSGTLLKKPAYLPFSAGPRTCIGDSMAKNTMFLIFTNLLQNFTFKYPGGEPAPHDDGYQPGITYRPHTFDLIAETR